ncbi:MAG: hypothetical protein ACJ74Q_02040 [Pyrinomonadaceae bacterium]
MAQELLVKEILSADEIAAGEKLLKRLDGAKAGVVAAYWVYVPAVAEWHLEFVSPKVESEGPREFYSEIGDLLSSPTRIDCLTLNTIMVLGPSYSFYKQLRAALNPKEDLAGVRLRQLLVGNEVMDLYIYRYPAKA